MGNGQETWRRGSSGREEGRREGKEEEQEATEYVKKNTTLTERERKKAYFYL